MGPLDGAVSAARRALAGTSDLERCLARLAASVGGPTAAAGSDGGSNGSSGGGFGREAAHVVLYEDVARRRVKVLVGAMKDLQALRTALEAFQQVHKKDTKGGAGLVLVMAEGIWHGVDKPAYAHAYPAQCLPVNSV